MDTWQTLMTGHLYEIVIRGTLGPTILASFEGFEVVSTANGQTRMRGWITDRSALHGVFEQISDFGLELTSVTSIDEPSSV